MRNLEQVLSPKDACVLYDPPLPVDGNPGMLRRISEAYHWPVEDLKLWQHPVRQAELARNRRQEVQQELSKLMYPLNVPIPFKVDDDGKISTGTPERKLERCRIDQCSDSLMTPSRST